jgi:predicted helicase
LSKQLINEYRADLDRLRAVSGSRRESVLREAFKDLLKRWGKSQDLQFVPEHDILTPQKTRIYVDGALLHALRVPFGYWEAKDADDDLDAEIADKFRKGYPRDNIIFSDDHTAVLWQDGHECRRVAMDDTDKLHDLLTLFFAHQRTEIADFNKAVKQFAADLPAVLESLRSIIADKRESSTSFAAAEAAFLEHAQKAINPAVSRDDVQEMLIQHILTEDIFAKVFDNPDFHRQNNVASELYKLEATLFGYGEKAKLLKALAPYYAGISATAAVIQSHSEKQGFLKGLYENFYKVYNAKAADRLGVVYTPGEIVRFMIRSADWLCEKHFGKNLIDPGVEILDPATGTGTFIVELLEHFRGDHAKLRHKYKEELHANEIAILPYYVANLNIEATYQAITGQFAEYPNLCLVDTLDNVAALGIYSGHQFDLLGSISDENVERIKRQNRRKISVIIGNPPYNAWQENFNHNNANRPYTRVDQRIAQTYVKQGSATNKSSVYDMYTRFVRWASDRIGDEGIIAFVIGRKPISKSAYDGFRKVVEKEFSEIWLFDLGGDVRDNPALSGTVNNVFGIQTGVMIALLVRYKGSQIAQIQYGRRPETETAEDKLSFLASSGEAKNFPVSRIKPDARNDWLNQISSELSGLPLFSENKARRGIFELFSMATQPKLDEWIYATGRQPLLDKMHYYISAYCKSLKDGEPDMDAIKWHRELVKKLRRRLIIEFSEDKSRIALWRPYTARWYYDEPNIVSMNFLQQQFFVDSNKAIVISGPGSEKPFTSLGIDLMPNHDLLEKAQVGPRYRFTKTGDRIDNITDWALTQFRKHYQASQDAGLHPKQITKDAIFHYVYAVLHDPIYRETYALNLKREFPRIPFYPDFARWAAWGEALMAMHIGYEDLAPWPVERVDVPGKRAAGTAAKPILRSDPSAGSVIVDGDTQITGIPREAWDYRLGNRSAIDWVLDQHKEKKPRDPTIAAKFNTYRFADYKESMIGLLAKVVRVSVETVAITEAMKAAERDPGSSQG